MTTKRYRVVGIDLDLGGGNTIPEGGEVDLDDAAAKDAERWLEPVTAKTSDPAVVTPPAGNGKKATAADKKQEQVKK